MTSKAIITKFQKIIREEFGKDISDQEAAVILDGLVGYCDKLAEIHHRQPSKVDINH